MKRKDLGYEERGEEMAPRDMTALNQKQRERENVWKTLFQLGNQWVLHLKHRLQDKNHV